MGQLIFAVVAILLYLFPISVALFFRGLLLEYPHPYQHAPTGTLSRKIQLSTHFPSTSIPFLLGFGFE